MRMLDKEAWGGRYYLKKGRVLDVIARGLVTVVTDDGHIVDQVLSLTVVCVYTYIIDDQATGSRRTRPASFITLFVCVCVCVCFTTECCVDDVTLIAQEH